MSIDLNADVGEGMHDEDLFPFLTSVNVACGLHAGDPSTMDETVTLAMAQGLRIGAHPGYPDRANFGRVAMEMPADAIERLVLYQIAALDGFLRSRAGALTHVKPHGALYHSGAEFPDVARAIAEGTRRFRADLILVGAPGSLLVEAGREAGLPVAEEAFADRRYMPDGTLMPRGRPEALITDPEHAADQAVRIVRDGTVVASDGSVVAIRADTLCVHGDTPGAAQIARRVRQKLEEAGIAVAPMAAGPAYAAAG